MKPEVLAALNDLVALLKKHDAELCVNRFGDEIAISVGQCLPHGMPSWFDHHSLNEHINENESN